MADDPHLLFDAWLAEAEASEPNDPNAVALATATPDGRPSVRIVLLKGLDDRGLTFFTGYGSRKGAEIEANPQAAAVMLWHPLQRQVRVEGGVTRIDDAESDAYFRSRPRGSQVGAVASPQSRIISSREAKYASDSASSMRVTPPSTRTWRCSGCHSITAAARGLASSSAPLRDS